VYFLPFYDEELFFHIIFIIYKYLFSYNNDVYHHFLKSFPTRRSSDLIAFTTLANNELVNPPIADTTITGRELTASFTIAQTLRRSEEHTSELQSLRQLVCRLLLEKKN